MSIFAHKRRNLLFIATREETRTSIMQLTLNETSITNNSILLCDAMDLNDEKILFYGFNFGYLFLFNNVLIFQKNENSSIKIVNLSVPPDAWEIMTTLNNGQYLLIKGKRNLYIFLLKDIIDGNTLLPFSSETCRKLLQSNDNSITPYQ